jgi:hypothetical protein
MPELHLEQIPKPSKSHLHFEEVAEGDEGASEFAESKVSLRVGLPANQ